MAAMKPTTPPVALMVKVCDVASLLGKALDKRREAHPVLLVDFRDNILHPPFAQVSTGTLQIQRKGLQHQVSTATKISHAGHTVTAVPRRM